MDWLKRYVRSSIGQKQVVAASGLLLVVFIFGHLGGNLLIYGGPDLFNAYAERLHSLGILLWMVRIALATVFFTHIYFTYRLVMANRAARPVGYKMVKAPDSYSAKWMSVTGTTILVFLVFHLWDYAFQDPYAKSSVIGNINLGLFGLVYNSFTNPVRVVLYSATMVALGFHLDHAIQSCLQTFGWVGPRLSCAKKVGRCIAIVVATLFAIIPFFVMLNHKYWILT